VVLNKKLRCKKGQTMVLIPLLMVVLLGIAAIVVDVAVLHVEKVALQNDVDAAVLAGGQELPARTGGAITIAKDYASTSKNGKVGDVVNPTVTNGNHSLTVSARRHVPLYFAKIFGYNTSDVTATATVTVGTVGGASGAIPVGVEEMGAFEYGHLYDLKVGGGSGYCGNYRALALGGNGANVYKDNLANGYSGVLKVGQVVDTEPGNKAGPTDQALDYRISQDPTATFATVQSGSSRIVIVPIMKSMLVNGRDAVKIVGFAVFFLEESSGGVITGRFMEMVIADSIGGSGTNYGAYKLRLTQ
jgi:hypothetical protein